MTATAVPADIPNNVSTRGLPDAESNMTLATTIAFRIRITGEYTAS